MDHVFPEAWYPDSTPPNLEKWKVPSCVPCNSAHGKLEEDLLRRLGLCLGPDELAAAGIPEKALRSIRPQHGRTERDKRARAAVRDKLRKEVTISDEPPSEGVFPKFGPRPGVDYEKYVTVPIPADSLIRLGRKIVRGLTYMLESKLLPDDEAIAIYFVDDHKVSDLIALVKATGKTYHRGPGIIVERSVAIDDPSMSLWHITIFGRVNIWAAVNANRTKSEGVAT